MAKAAGPDSYLKINGKKINTVQGSLKIKTGGMKRTAVVADQQVHYIEEMTGSVISAEILLTPTTNIAEINAVTGGVVEAYLTTNKKGVQTSSFQSSEPVSLDLSSGKATVEFTGDAITGL